MAKIKSIVNAATEQQVHAYEIVKPLLTSAYNEIKELSKKKQDENLNVKKVKIINRLLVRSMEFLKEEPTSEFLELLDEDDLPTNSDAFLILSQFLEVLDQFHSTHYHIYSLDNPNWVSGGQWDTFEKK